MTITEAQSQYEKELAAYQAIPSRSRKLKHAAAERLCAAMKALKAANPA
jgi:hypothetical protein